MADFELHSAQFRREREADWLELEELLKRADSQGVEALDSSSLHRLPLLYRGALSGLSVARSISLDQSLLSYLENLAARAYVVVYGVPRDPFGEVVEFFVRGFPAQVWRLRWAVVISILVMALGCATGWVMVDHDLELFYTFVSDRMAGERGPTSSTEELRQVLETHRGSGGELALFSGILFSHNASIGLLCFGLGFAAGLPVILLLWSNGLTLGAFAAIHARQNLGAEFWGWVLPHGISELLAICLCGAAGLSIGMGLLFPGRYSRIDSLRRAGLSAAKVVLGAAAMLFLAALIEGFFRQWVTGQAVRYSVATVTLLSWIWYFAIHGRRSA